MKFRQDTTFVQSVARQPFSRIFAPFSKELVEPLDKSQQAIHQVNRGVFRIRVNYPSCNAENSPGKIKKGG